MFNSSLLYGSDSQVRTAAVRAFVAFLCDNEEDDTLVRQLSQLIPAVIQGKILFGSYFLNFCSFFNFCQEC